MLYLAGGGDATQSKEIDADFAKCIDGKKLMYIPVALHRDALGFEACYDWITALFQNFEYAIDIPEIHMYLDPKAIAGRMCEYDALYIGGGNTFKLLDFLYKNNLFEKIKAFYESGKPVYGGSAGAIIFGKDIRTVEEENDANYTYTAGFNFLRGRSCICHYKPVLDANVMDFVHRFGQEVIAIPEDAGIKMENGEITKIFGQPYMFHQHGKTKILTEN